MGLIDSGPAEEGGDPVVRELSKTEARGAEATGHRRWILGLSLSATVAVLLIAFLIYRF
jgi:hypothetical protein